MAYLSTKTYGHEVGLSATFRQWRAKSHCRLLHGYSLSFRFEFEANTLDDKNWVVDFGGLKELRAILEDTFDHKTVVAADDPELEWFREAARRGLADIVVLPAVGCEKFAEIGRQAVLPINEIFETIQGEACKGAHRPCSYGSKHARSGVRGATRSTRGSPIQSGGCR